MVHAQMVHGKCPNGKCLTLNGTWYMTKWYMVHGTCPNGTWYMVNAQVVHELVFDILNLPQNITAIFR